MAAQINHAVRMRTRAAAIRNEVGDGDISSLREGVADLLEAMAGIVETGYQTPAECLALHEAINERLKPRFGWPAAAAVLAACGTVAALVLKVTG